MTVQLLDRERPLTDFAMPEAEMAANALAKLFRECSEEERARKFGSGNPSKRVNHRASICLEKGAAGAPAAKLRELRRARTDILRELRQLEDQDYVLDPASKQTVDAMATLRSAMTGIEDRIRPLQAALDMMRAD